MDASHAVLQALEASAPDKGVLKDESITLADCHIGAMLDSFTEAPEADALVQTRPHLDGWWRKMRTRPQITGLDLQGRWRMGRLPTGFSPASFEAPPQDAHDTVDCPADLRQRAVVVMRDKPLIVGDFRDQFTYTLQPVL